MRNLIGALKFLHGELQIEKSPNTYCTHMDLNPQNILIFAGGPVGTWKINDFGISSFKSRFQAIRGFAETSRQTHPVRQGTHCAPELHPDFKGTFLDRGTDVWSYGCILAEVVAFARGGAKAVEDFQSLRCENSSHDWFFEVLNRREIRESEALSWEGKQFFLKPSIVAWIDRFKDVPVVLHNLIRRTLIPNFRRRLSASEVYELFHQTSDEGTLQRYASPNPVPERWDLCVPKGVREWGLSSNGETAAFLFNEEVIQCNLRDPVSKHIAELHGLSLGDLTSLQMHVAGTFVLVMGYDKKNKRLEV